MRYWTMLLVGVIAGASGVKAQLADPVAKCLTIEEPDARLYCYDEAVVSARPELQAVLEARQAAAKARAQQEALAVRERDARKKVDAFGAGNRSGGAAVEALNAEVAEVLTDGSGRLMFVLREGQMWRQTDGGAWPTVRPGDAVVIRRGAMGGYRLAHLRLGRTVSVRRVR